MNNGERANAVISRKRKAAADEDKDSVISTKRKATTSEGKDSAANLDPPHTCVLIVGQSNSGKSNLVRQLAREFRHFRRKIVCLNDNTKTCPYPKITWDASSLDQQDGVILIIEDIIALKQRNFDILSHILSWRVHHQSLVPCYVIAHAILKTNIHGLLPYFTHFYLSACPSNSASFKKLLSYFSYSAEEKAAYTDRLNKCTNPDVYEHFLFSVRARTVQLVRYPYLPPEDAAELSDSEEETDMDKIKQRRADKQKDAVANAKAKRFLSVGAVLKDKDRSECALAIWDLLYPSLPRSKINEFNLTITLKRNNSSNNDIVISIIDYVCTLLNENAEPTDIMVKFHRFVTRTKGIKIPLVFIGNKYFHDYYSYARTRSCRLNENLGYRDPKVGPPVLQVGIVVSAFLQPSCVDAYQFVDKMLRVQLPVQCSQLFHFGKKQ
jgi:energy-coupling factor transporter ATP-binding protein EcfA2